MKILVVGLCNSIHLAKSVSSLQGAGWDVHVVSSIEMPWHTRFDGCTLHHTSRLEPLPDASEGVRVVDHRPRFGGGTSVASERSHALARLIDEIRPDIVHSQEMQSGAYQTLVARESCERPFPIWIVSNWGSDIYYHARPPDHRRAVRAVLSKADYFWAECWRDVALARGEGFTGVPLPTLPIAGGFDIEHGIGLRRPGLTSQRTAIAVKGYQNDVGRAFNTVAALGEVGDLLQDRELILYAHDSSVEQALRLVAFANGAHVTTLVKAPFDEILAMHGRSRVSIGLSLSDGASTSFLEALLGGSFPIQSWTSCAAEWVTHGETGLLVDPTDIRQVAAALRAAMTDDEMVDSATPRNDATVRSALDADAIRAGFLAGYQTALAGGLQHDVGSR